MVQGGSSGLVVTPVLVILVAMVAGLALVAVCIIFVMRGEEQEVCSEENNQYILAVKHSKAVAGAGAAYRSTHIPLDKAGPAPRLSSAHCLSEKNPDIIPPNKGVFYSE